MRKLACALLILVIVCGLSFVGGVEASTSVGGLLTANTTWTRANSPYLLTGPVGVQSGVTLTIEPGVTVEFSGYYIQVNGTLMARGTDENKIIFTSVAVYAPDRNPRVEFTALSTAWNEQAGSGCIIEKATVTNVTLAVSGGSPKIMDCTIVNSGGFASGAVSVSSGSPTVTKNLITGTGYQSGVYAGGSGYFSGNNIIHFWVGVSASGQATVEGNLIERCYRAGIESTGSSVSIQRNYISNCYYGISGGANIQSNTIVNNKVGIQSPTGSIITNNNIYNNTENSIVLTASNPIDAKNNWWGTIDSQTISQTIRDSKNDYNLGTVTYTPFLTSPSSTAPSAPDRFSSAPTPTPAPLSPSPTTPTPTQAPVVMPEPIQTPTPYLPEPTPTATPVPPFSIGGGSSADNTAWRLDVTTIVVVVVVTLGVSCVLILGLTVNTRVRKQPNGNP